MPSVAGYRPAAVLLHTAETEAALIDVADGLGVACLQLQAPAVLRQSVRSVWDLGKERIFCPQLHAVLAQDLYFQCSSLLSFCAVSTVKVFFVTKEAIKTLRLAPTLGRRLSSEGTLCQVDTERFASLVSPALVTVLDRSSLGCQQLCPLGYVLHQAEILHLSNCIT